MVEITGSQPPAIIGSFINFTDELKSLGTFVGYNGRVILVDKDRRLILHGLSVIDVNSP